MTVVHVPAEQRGVMDALLLGLDPRLTVSQREDAMLAAVAEAPHFVAGVLAGVIELTNARIEQLRGYPPGTLVDRMRAEYLGAPEVLDEPEVLGVALHDARDGEPVTFRLAVDDPPARPPATGQAARVGTGPNGEWTVADAAISAEHARRARQAADLGLATPDAGGRDQTGGQGLTDALRPPSVDMPRQGVVPEADPRVAEHLSRLARQRRDEAAIDNADLDRPETMQAAMTAAIDPAQVADSAQPLTDVPLQAVSNIQGVSNGGNLPVMPFTPCGHPTVTGPCVLRAGHPKLPVPGTENGHMSQETLR